MKIIAIIYALFVISCSLAPRAQAIRNIEGIWFLLNDTMLGNIVIPAGVDFHFDKNGNIFSSFELNNIDIILNGTIVSFDDNQYIKDKGTKSTLFYRLEQLQSSSLGCYMGMYAENDMLWSTSFEKNLADTKQKAFSDGDFGLGKR